MKVQRSLKGPTQFEFARFYLDTSRMDAIQDVVVGNDETGYFPSIDDVLWVVASHGGRIHRFGIVQSFLQPQGSRRE